MTCARFPRSGVHIWIVIAEVESLAVDDLCTDAFDDFVGEVVAFKLSHVGGESWITIVGSLTCSRCLGIITVQDAKCIP